MRMTPCESTPRRFAHTTPCAQVAAIAGATPAAVKIAAAKPVRSDLVRRMWSLMGVELSERRGSVEPPLAMSRVGGGCCPRLLRGDAGDPHHVDHARHFVFQGPCVIRRPGPDRLDPGDRELADHVGLLHDGDRFGGDLPDDRLW